LQKEPPQTPISANMRRLSQTAELRRGALIVARQFRSCPKTHYFATPPVGAVHEPPTIRVLLEAPLPNKLGGL